MTLAQKNKQLVSVFSSFVNTIKVFFYILIVFVSFSYLGCDTATTAPDPIVIEQSAYERNKLLSRTINLGNALEAPNEGEWGVTLEAEYFTIIKNAGFTAVRIPIRWSAHAGVIAPYTINPVFMNRVKWAINNSLVNGLAVIVNMHHYEEMFSDPQIEKTRFLALWGQISEELSGYDGSVIFEILNEPNGNLTPELWNTLLAEAVAVIRMKNPKRTIMIGTAEWGGVSAINRLQLPAGEKNIIVTFHYYEPFRFTHQGAEWVENSNAWLGTQWGGSEAELAVIESDFRKVSDWAKSQGVPVFLGEFGAYYKAYIDSRVRWTSVVRSISQKYNFSWGYWEFCAGFGIYDRQSATFNSALLNALIPPS